LSALKEAYSKRILDLAKQDEQ